MLDNNTIAVVVPARNEAALIDQTLSTMPDFVDHLIVIDDAVMGVRTIFAGCACEVCVSDR